MTQQLIVGLIVALAAIYAIWRWMPAGWRRSAASRLAAGSHRAGLVDRQRADALAASLSKSSGCGACESCGSCGTSAMPKAGTSSEKTTAPGNPSHAR